MRRVRRYEHSPRSSRGARERGVALLTAVLIVALATILATEIGFRSALEQRRGIGLLLLDQGFQVSLGAEAWAAKYLRDDLNDGAQIDHLGERWATPIPPIPLEGGPIEGTLEGQVEDLTAVLEDELRAAPAHHRRGVPVPRHAPAVQHEITLVGHPHIVSDRAPGGDRRAGRL